MQSAIADCHCLRLNVCFASLLEIRRAHFCGLSLGGATALGLAEQYPDRIDRVIVCNSACASTSASAKQWEERIITAKGGGMAAITESTLQRRFPPDVYAANPAGVIRVREMVLSTPLNGFIGCCAALGDHNFRSAVASVSRPVLFLVGEKDPPNAIAADGMNSIALCYLRSCYWLHWNNNRRPSRGYVERNKAIPCADDPDID